MLGLDETGKKLAKTVKLPKLVGSWTVKRKRAERWGGSEKGGGAKEERGGNMLGKKTKKGACFPAPPEVFPQPITSPQSPKFLAKTVRFFYTKTAQDPFKDNDQSQGRTETPIRCG
ncbi:hypothetical protein, partial [Neisseria sp. P0024.S006]|uniref:hypothetical protein n=1 Tax=Neisseria sp. P0024.S006 TaxID=3436850 RepID=UPI003F7D350C